MYTIDTRDAVWAKSSRSTNGNCVEVARLQSGHVGIRDSKNQNGPVLIFPQGEWTAFIGGVKSGEFGR
ncbi:DUF397 domain-containing protein [Thermopolyspora sp. NPDC052614]|uniref:DUF397 domain-containing protein n=1 Tax=Thermopolyspora sp. NPDC052614 TaxID=3155682 RepID=UPI003446D81F